MWMLGETRSICLVLHDLPELFSDCVQLISHVGEFYAATAFREKILRVHFTFAVIGCQSREINVQVIAYLIPMHTLPSVRSDLLALARKVSFILARKVKTCQDL